MIIKETVFNSNRNHILTQEQSKVHKKYLRYLEKNLLIIKTEKFVIKSICASEFKL